MLTGAALVTLESYTASSLLFFISQLVICQITNWETTYFQNLVIFSYYGPLIYFSTFLKCCSVSILRKTLRNSLHWLPYTINYLRQVRPTYIVSQNASLNGSRRPKSLTLPTRSSDLWGMHSKYWQYIQLFSFCQQSFAQVGSTHERRDHRQMQVTPPCSPSWMLLLHQQ